MAKNIQFSESARMIDLARSSFIGLAILAASWALASGPAHALPQLQIIQGGNTLTITDQDVNDASGDIGGLAFVGSVGDFSFNVSGAATKPLIGGSTDPRMDLSSLNINGTSSGIIQLLFTETDFVGNGSPLTIITGIGGGTAGTVTFEAYASASNTGFATDILLGSSGILNGPTFDFDTVASLALNGSYSLTTVVTITHATGGLNSSVNAIIEVPEPALSPALFVGALVVSANVLRRRTRRTA